MPFMRILFALGMVVSLILIFTNSRKNEPQGILEAVLDSKLETEAGFVPSGPFRIVSEFQKNESGQMIETRRGYSENDELISERSYLNGKRFGEHKFFKDKVLRVSAYYFRKNGRWPITINYSAEGKVVEAFCHEGISFTPEHKRVCGFDGPFSFVSDKSGRKVEATLVNGRAIKRKEYFPDGRLWLEYWAAGDKYFQKTYSLNGKLSSQHMTDKIKREEQKFDEEGRVVEKWTYLQGKKPYREEVIVYDRAGNEESQWSVAKKGFGVESCSLMRSIASTPRKPGLCP